MQEDLVITRKKGAIFEIVLNRPDCYNALSNAVMDQLREALLAFKKDDEVHVAILKGAGKNFCSGADIKQFGDAEAQTPRAIRKRADASMEVHGIFSSINKPIICCVQGYALAGGCGLALAGDIVIASEDAVFGYPEIKRGFVPALVLVNLSKIVGRRFALEMILTGRKVNASEAYQKGLINEVVPKNQLEERVWELASEMALLNPDSLAYTKGLYYQVADLELEKGLQCGRDINMLMRQTKEFAQGASAFNKGKNC